MKKLIIILLAAFSLTGCSTLMTLDDPTPYSGVQQDLDQFSPCYGIYCVDALIIRPLAIIDLPFSFVGDTLMLPVKGIQNLVKD
ncbi:YceK/YidQ family lipoprotein [Actinobacillus minor]|uniref:YceK/YidQ family lipoprotein n=1 Tax=Actinobacillus minor TaxID=51047 RepID=UPI0026EE636C|nr:YceK/YidQ family lipoprotein [Actinobacillus minor]